MSHESTLGDSDSAWIWLRMIRAVAGSKEAASGEAGGAAGGAFGGAAGEVGDSPPPESNPPSDRGNNNNNDWMSQRQWHIQELQDAKPIELQNRKDSKDNQEKTLTPGG
jgi:hypothetical protein